MLLGFVVCFKIPFVKKCHAYAIIAVPKILEQLFSLAWLTFLFGSEHLQTLRVGNGAEQKLNLLETLNIWQIYQQTNICILIISLVMLSKLS